ncbi:MAG: copper resistance CopC/CopD family protein, partial [Xanthobacteraceae bacterium]
FAPASLVRAEPADGAMLAETPKALKLTFNEPVSVLVMRLIGPSGEVIAPGATAENNVVTLTPPRLRQGSHVLSWRVVSADGHPVGGSVVFSIGAASGTSVAASNNTIVRSALWGAKLAIYLAMFLGIGGAFFQIWAGVAGCARATSVYVALLIGGLIAAPISVGLQGLDALDLPVSQLMQVEVWRAGWGTAYGLTALTAECAMLAGLLAFVAPVRLGRALALVGLLGIGLALLLSGHAGTVAPRWLTRSAVFLHGITVAFWIGALIPLVVAIGVRDRDALMRFSRLIPVPLAILVATGCMLMFVQLDRVDALWTTRYGLVLSGKLAVVALLIGLAAANRFALVPRFAAAASPPAGRPLATSIRAELALALVILALVASWRFTPPPRALAASERVFLHIHGERGMAEIDIEPERGRARTSVKLMDPELHPLAAKELTLVLANAAAGIEPMLRQGVSEGDGFWRIGDLRIPVAGRWQLRVEILISDFDKLVLDEEIDLPRVP